METRKGGKPQFIKGKVLVWCPRRVPSPPGIHKRKKLLKRAFWNLQDLIFLWEGTLQNYLSETIQTISMYHWSYKTCKTRKQWNFLEPHWLFRVFGFCSFLWKGRKREDVKVLVLSICCQTWWGVHKESWCILGTLLDVYRAECTGCPKKVLIEQNHHQNWKLWG